MAAILTPFWISSLLPIPSEKPPSLKKPLLDDKKHSISPDSLIDNPSSEKDEFEVLHAKFIGEVDLSECEEPLLKYHKVNIPLKEMDLSKDLHHRNTHLNDNEQQFISCILVFFAVLDGIVNENLARRFSNEIMMENIHLETYSLLIDSYIKNPHKADWTLKWILDQHSTFATCLIAFAAVEGISFPVPSLPYSDALPVALIRMNAKLMCQYIEFVTNRLLISLGNEKVYNVTSLFNIHGYDFLVR
ncbi:beta subunit of ribonucleotide reductase [Boletus coccyginus]|nr:beta subunit of ribonucleotide reductase [Boletus coccyginus]